MSIKLQLMKTVAQIEKDFLSLPPDERARLAVLAWESLESDPAFTADPSFDPEGIATARGRDEAIATRVVEPIDHDEFVARTSGDKRKAQ